MPYANGPGRTVTSILLTASTPILIYRARQVTGHTSNASYMREAIAAALSRDLGIPMEELLKDMPTPRPAEGWQSGPCEEVR